MMRTSLLSSVMRSTGDSTIIQHIGLCYKLLVPIFWITILLAFIYPAIQTTNVSRISPPSLLGFQLELYHLWRILVINQSVGSSHFLGLFVRPFSLKHTALFQTFVPIFPDNIFTLAYYTNYGQQMSRGFLLRPCRGFEECVDFLKTKELQRMDFITVCCWHLT